MAFNPAPVTDERDGLATFLAFQQEAVRAIAHGLTDEQAHRAPSASAISIAWLIKHLSVVQENWLDGALTAPQPLTDDQVAVIMARVDTPERSESLETLLADFDAISTRVIEAVRTLDPATPLPVPNNPWFPKDITHWSIRWVWLHLIQEFARHAGHGDIVRETLDGATAYPLIAARDGHTEPVFGFLEPWSPQEAPFTRGVSTVVLAADDVGAARRWYADMLGVEAYYETPAYVEFRLGPHAQEWGILDRRFAGAAWGEGATDVRAGVVAHLWVEDADAALARLIEHGATEHQPIRAFGPDGEAATGYRGGSVVDPFGNIVGLIERPG